MLDIEILDILRGKCNTVELQKQPQKINEQKVEKNSYTNKDSSPNPMVINKAKYTIDYFIVSQEKEADKKTKC